MLLILNLIFKILKGQSEDIQKRQLRNKQFARVCGFVHFYAYKE
jgi:hypothetical protein